MQGKIIKGIAGFYYVHTQEVGILECKAKGVFRKENMKPLTGDDVEIEVISAEAGTGNVVKILPRKNKLIRPAVANIDQALVIFSIVKPSPNYNLLDRFLIMMEQQKLKTIICFNKQDIADEAQGQELLQIYERAGCQVLFVSARRQEGIEELKELLLHKTTTVAGPSGVGKSTIINLLCPQAEMATGDISTKIERGKHTTRHTELFHIGGSSYIMDTPGFSSLSLFEMEKEELKTFYPEFEEYESQCRFRGCAHIEEPECAAKQAVLDGKISSVRYENYKLFYEEIKNRKKY